MQKQNKNKTKLKFNSCNRVRVYAYTIYAFQSVLFQSFWTMIDFKLNEFEFTNSERQTSIEH